MANMETMVPHILNWEVGLKSSERNLSLRKMYESVRGRGYHLLLNDKGGPTMCGVTLGTFTDWRRRHGHGTPSVAELKTLDYDEWLSILKGLFWDPCRADSIASDSVAMMLVDWRWVNGTQAIRDAQTVFSLVADGIVGPKTLGALNSGAASEVFSRLKYAREASYRRIVARNPSQGKWLKGWLNRTNSIEFKK